MRKILAKEKVEEEASPAKSKAEESQIRQTLKGRTGGEKDTPFFYFCFIGSFIFVFMYGFFIVIIFISIQLFSATIMNINIASPLQAHYYHYHAIIIITIPTQTSPTYQTSCNNINKLHKHGKPTKCLNNR